VFHDSGSPVPFDLPPADLAFSKQVAGYWSSMSHYGNPNMFNPDVKWEMFKNDTRMNILLNLETSMQSNTNAFNCDMFDEIGYDTERDGPIMSRIIDVLRKI
jgi:hypothetical protein